MKNEPITIAGHTIEPGSRVTLKLPTPDLYAQTEIRMPVHVFHGKKAGPKVFVVGTIHGDELNSIEIIRRLQKHKSLTQLSGTLITIPVANVYGFIQHKRDLPDGRDLNRSFPGSKEGSLTARLANMLITDIFSKCQYGIDLHTGGFGRMNMPQLRVNLETPGVKDLAIAFEVPVILDARIRDGSLREAASELGIPLLVYEGGEALRYNELSIRVGVRGIMHVLHYLNMLPKAKKPKKVHLEPIISNISRWIRAPTSGMVQAKMGIAQTVREGDVLASIHDPFLINPSETIKAPFDGVIIGLTNLPLANEGDALYHIASIKKLENVEAYIEELKEQVQDQH